MTGRLLLGVLAHPGATVCIGLTAGLTLIGLATWLHHIDRRTNRKDTDA